MSLFPQQVAGTASLCSFSAGKMILAPTADGKFNVTADPRRGTISLVKEADGMLHFKWANGVTGAVEDDRIVFPGENVFKRVNTGNPTDRVYMLQYVSGNQRLMYWMQKKSDENDEADVKRVNEVIANPNAAAPATAAAGAAPAPGTAVGPNEWMQMLGLNAPAGAAAAAPVPVNNSGFGNLDLSSLLNPAAARPPVAAPVAAAAASTAAPAAAPVVPTSSSGAAPSAGLTIEDLQRAMFGGQAGASAAAHAQGRHHGQPETPALQDIIQADDVIASGVLDDPTVQMELLSLLPEGQQTTGHLQSTVRSAQFQQALGSLTHAVQHPDNFQSVMSNFGIDPAPGTNQLVRGDGVGAFLTSVQAANPPEATAATPTTAATTTTAETKSGEGDKKEEDGSAPMDEE